ncbi:MAG: hypothetical protein V7L31_18990 [Nostoc sp.]|uniref:hypothetical protein n=1 Tax=Nostoc sp. TaxID=1180 RepID=UPI002FF02D59
MSIWEQSDSDRVRLIFNRSHRNNVNCHKVTENNRTSFYSRLRGLIVQTTHNGLMDIDELKRLLLKAFSLPAIA